MVSVGNNSILKKTIAVFMLMITAFVFFSFSASATTYNPTTYNSFSDSITISDVTYSLRVTQFKALSTGTSMLPSGMETIMFVVFQLTNDNNQDALCQVPQFSIDLSDQRVITDVYTYAGDLALGITSNGFIVLPTQPYSYDASNKIVVPANSTLTLVGGIGLPAQLNQTGDGTLDTGLRNVHLLYKPYTVTLGSYVHGTPIDLTPIIGYIDNIESYLSDISTSADDIANDTGTILTTIQNLANLITYTGSEFDYNPGTNYYSHTNYTKFYPSDNNKLGYFQIRRLVSNPVYNAIDVQSNSASDTQVVNGTKTYQYSLKISTRAVTDIKLYYEALLTGLFPVVYIPTIDYFYSEVYSGISYDGTTVRLVASNRIGDYTYLKTGYYTTYIVGHITVDDDYNLQLDPINIDSAITGITTDNSNYYLPQNSYYILRDLYLAYSQVNGLNDSSDISNDVADVSDSNHIIEESYYSANASAIEATGLSNYRFSNEQNNGIGKVSSDFMLLWNALGSWNGVYIFSLTMALATFIMRHGGLFTIKRQTSDKGGDGD